MRARVPKEWENLSPRQKERLKAYLAEIATDAARKQEEHDCQVILNLYMRMVCCVLHDAFGFGERRLRRFILNHRRLFIQQNRLVEKGEQVERLNQRMAEIFRKEGFPQYVLDDFFGEVRLVDRKDDDPEW